MAELVSLFGGYLTGLGGTGSMLAGLGTSLAGEAGLASTWGQVGQALGKMSQRMSPPTIPPTSELPSPPTTTYAPPRQPRSPIFSQPLNFGGGRRGRKGEGGGFDIFSYLPFGS